MTRATRPAVALWRIAFNLVAVTELRTSSGEPGHDTDAELLVDDDGEERLPLVLGTSLKGALRSHLVDELGGYGLPEAALAPAVLARVEALFGKGQANPNDVGQGAIILPDALGAPSARFVRHHNRIDPKTRRVAENQRGGPKFDAAVWARGTTFNVELDLLIDSSDGEQQLVDDLAFALNGFVTGHVRVGARTNRGSGQCRVDDLAARRIDLTTADGWVERALGWTRPHEEFDQWAQRLTRRTSAAKWLRITAMVTFGDGILVGEDNSAPDGPDRRNLTTTGVAADQGERLELPGTSLVGAGIAAAASLNARAIAGDVNKDRGVRVTKLLSALFGHVDGPGAGSAVRADSVPLRDAVEIDVIRIAIDAWSNAPITGAMLEERVPFNGTADLRVMVRCAPDDPADAMFGLTMLAVKDVVMGLRPLGATSSIGRGYVTGRQPLTIELHDNGIQQTFDVPLDGSVSGEVRAMVERWVAAAHAFISDETAAEGAAS